jgi:type 2 lantibiotic biosynthesis protein LanM
LQGTAAANCPRTYYDGFVGGFSDSGRGGEMAALFARWPVLANLLDRVVTFWVESTGEFLNRVRDDMELLDEASRVTFIRTHLSDRHRNGRTVLAVEFESGRWWIYKPRTLAMEAAYFDLLSWCNQQQELPWSFQMLRVLNRGDYGWMEFAAPSPCEDAAEVSRFYERAGALLALLYVLRGTDCHCENIIAAGEHPVLIDAEALFHPEMKPAAMGEAPEAPQLAGQLLDDSVLRTGLLPRWEVSAASGTARDVSALGAGAGGPDSVQVERWTAVNTDHMHRALQDRLRVPPFHLPVLPGCAISPDDYVPKLIDGFAAMYRFLARRGEDAFARFQGLPMRYLFRWTALYQTVTARSISLASLRDPAEREKEVALLARLFEAGDAHPESRRILETERAAIERLDIPYFQGSTSGTALMDETGAIVIADVFEKPPHQDALERWRRMSDEDEALQVKFIAGSFQARQAQNAPRSDSGRGATPEELAREELPGRATLLQQAEEISRELAARAWRNSDGSVNWIGLLQAENSQQYQLSPLSARLYDGSSGIALFLAALHNTTGSLESAELAQAALSPLRDFLRSTSKGSRARFLRYLGIGGGTGVGSMIYSLVKISGLLKDSPGFLPEATLLAQHIDDDALRADRQLDVIGGAAGALLGLLTLHSATNDSDALDRAVRCGNVLLEKRVSVKGTFKAWITTETEPLTGFAHGAAGIAYALLRLYAACGQRKFFQAAEEAVAYEQSTFNSDLNNWPTWKKGAVPWYMVNWCHGATGIGLGRLGGLPWMDSPEIRQEIDAALATTQNWGAQDVDHLCCGNAGRVELFLKAGRRDDALRLLGWVLRRARIAGGYRIFPNFRDHVFSPGFFQGTAGIGYTLLRAATDASLPSVLLWD